MRLTIRDIHGHTYVSDSMDREYLLNLLRESRHPLVDSDPDMALDDALSGMEDKFESFTDLASVTATFSGKQRYFNPAVLVYVEVDREGL